MANVFTTRSGIPRSTTLCDFGYRSQALGKMISLRKKGEPPEIRRTLSPTRRQNPQPIGLVYQSPYNRFNNVFGIWNPNLLKPVMRSKQTLPHLCRTNFTCQHDPVLLERSMAPADPSAPVERKQPEVGFARLTVQRRSYMWPPETPERFKGMVKHTRFGHTPSSDGPAVGIVPNIITRMPSARMSRCSDKGRISCPRHSRRSRSTDQEKKTTSPKSPPEHSSPTRKFQEKSTAGSRQSARIVACA